MPTNDGRQPEPLPSAGKKSAIVTTISRKRARLLRAEQRAAEPDDDPEATAAIQAWLERAKWGHGPAG